MVRRAISRSREPAPHRDVRLRPARAQPASPLREAWVVTPTKTAHTRAYRKGTLVAEDFPLAEVSDRLDDDGTVVWVDFCTPSADDMIALASELGLHELAVEDALGEHQRPKVDYYSTHFFL